jgi:hypothetical protein
MNNTLALILKMKDAEAELNTQELSQAMKDYMQASDGLILSMQAYIDYLLMDEDSVDGDDIKP